MARIDTDEALRRSLIARGRERASQFRWEEAARQTLAAFEEALR